MNESLPKGWIIGTLNDLLQSIKTGVPEYSGEKFYYSTGSINGANHIPEGLFSYAKRPSRANRIALFGDVMQARMKGTNKGIFIDEKLNNQLFSTGFIQLRSFNNTYDSKLLHYYIVSQPFLTQKDELTTGSTQEALTDTKATDLFFFLPPLNEQKRIVERLDQIIPRINVLQTRLNKIPTIIKRFRQSVLTAAVTGKLTESWRDKHPDIESAEELFIKISKARIELIKNGDIKNTEQNKPKKLEAIPYELPQTWKWVRFNSISKLITDGKHGDCKDEENSGYFFLSAKDVKNGTLVYENSRQITFNDFLEVHKRTNLQPNDLCIVNTGATVGKIALVKDDQKTPRTTFQKSVAVIKLIDPFIQSRFIETYLRRETENLIKISGGSAVNNLLLSTLKDLPIPLSPLEEQKEIVRQVEKLLSIADKLEEHYQQANARIDKLSQSVLAKAFRGELVITEAELAEKEGREFESAEKLLARIMEEKKKLAYTSNKTKKERKVGN